MALNISIDCIAFFRLSARPFVNVSNEKIWPSIRAWLIGLFPIVPVLHGIPIIVYDLRTPNVNFVALTPEQTETTTMTRISADIVVDFSCSGMGATNLNSKGPTYFIS